MPDKYSDDFEVVVEEADRIKISMKKMKRWVIVSRAQPGSELWGGGEGKIFLA